MNAGLFCELLAGNSAHLSLVLTDTMEGRMSELVRGDGAGLAAGSLMAFLAFGFIVLLTISL